MSDHHAPQDAPVLTAVQNLVHRLFRALDARDFAPGWMGGLATEDVRMETPVGAAKAWRRWGGSPRSRSSGSRGRSTRRPGS
ncbi:hypothetical protein ACIHCM_18155 [Streptomyces sp. NPDC052023]|uniref:hypothetical protein n=1 Tax=Streptomyces sp. NPDC052023 TaxID=3365681 RepID=UPI0037D05B21